jgi:Major Facilitator Superfamily
VSTRSAYRLLPRVAGPGLLVIAFLARLPAAMAPLGVIVLVSSVTGSFSQAGIATAALGIGAALGGPVTGWLTDVAGQRTIGLATALVNAGALVATALVVLGGGGVVATAAFAALTGLASPQVGPLARVRWSALLPIRGHGELLPTAMAYEGGADETSYVVGPALVGLLALIGPPVLPLAAAAALTIGAAVPFAMHPTATAGLRRSRRTATSPSSPALLPVAAPSGSVPLPVAALVVLGIVMTAIGLVFGSTQTGITALAEASGHAGVAGLIYSVLGVGSATAGLATAWLPGRFTLDRRLSAFAALLFAGALGLLAIRGVAVAALAMLILGVAVAPLLVTAYAVAERIAPPARMGTVITLLASGTVAGVALGAGVAGPLAQAYGYSAALAVPAFAGALALLAGMAGRRSIAAALETAVRRREIIATDLAAEPVSGSEPRPASTIVVAAGQSR